MATRAARRPTIRGECRGPADDVVKFRAMKSLYSASRGAACAASRRSTSALPQRCALCARAAGDALVCARLRARDSRRPRPACPRCALPSPAATVCGALPRASAAVRRGDRRRSPMRSRSTASCRRSSIAAELALAGGARRAARARRRAPRGATARVRRAGARAARAAAPARARLQPGARDREACRARIGAAARARARAHRATAPPQAALPWRAARRATCAAPSPRRVRSTARASRSSTT